MSVVMDGASQSTGLVKPCKHVFHLHFSSVWKQSKLTQNKDEEILDNFFS